MAGDSDYFVKPVFIDDVSLDLVMDCQGVDYSRSVIVTSLFGQVLFWCIQGPSGLSSFIDRVVIQADK